MLDHGASLIVCFYFLFPIRYIPQLDIPDFVRFLYDGPLHCYKVEKRSTTYDCMQVHGFVIKDLHTFLHYHQERCNGVLVS